VRWAICALLFFATTINYIDRQVIGVLKPMLSEQLGWSEIDYGNLITAFQIAYAAGYLYGWPAAFLATGALGFLWLLAWGILYRTPDRHPRVTPAELAHIRSDPPDPPARVPWLALLRHRQTWAFTAAMFLIAPVWWFYLYWIPDFLNKRHGLDLLSLGPPLVAIYLITDVGSVAGGWLSSRLLKRGWSANAARKTAMLACALCVVPVLAAP
jgi:ACS family hexuronate transporter-like MFS transporter